MASIDIDLDGIKDIVAFDVHGRRILPYQQSRQRGRNQLCLRPFLCSSFSGRYQRLSTTD